jgi:hypothetical protein
MSHAKIAADQESSKEGFFVNKKKQKTFLCWAVGIVGTNAYGPYSPKVFASLFRKYPLSPTMRQTPPLHESMTSHVRLC